MTDRLETLLDSAEMAIRGRGYHAVSFRDLADDLGIKSASVHYYFRHKEDLGIALVERYSRQFFDALEEQASLGNSAADRLQAIGTVYKSSLLASNEVCLCGMLGAETCGLPEPLAQKVQSFFTANIDWITDAVTGALPSGSERNFAIQATASLQGGMMLANSLDDIDILDQAINGLMTQFNLLQNAQ